ncbi:MAG: TylF/MycF/NovP-related O-methyltransferase [Pseudomonadota bacterium]
MTTPVSSPAPSAQPQSLGTSLGVKLKTVTLRPILNLLMAVLPESAFDKFYKAAFPVYKAISRHLYLAWNIVSLRYFSGTDGAMVQRVHKVMPYSLVGAGGLEVTDWAARTVIENGVPGDMVELGVARGGCAALLGMQIAQPAVTGRTLWLFDSYEGLPEPGDNDYVEEGDFTGDHVRPLPAGSCFGALEEVRWLLLDKCRVPEDRIEFVKGWFENTIPETKDRIGAVAVLRMDGDWYESTKISLEAFYDKVSPGGIVIIDDYESCIGSKRAVDEFIAARSLPVTMEPDGRGGRWFEKSH